MMKLVGGDSNTAGKPQQAADQWAVGSGQWAVQWAVGRKQEAGGSSPSVRESVLH